MPATNRRRHSEGQSYSHHTPLFLYAFLLTLLAVFTYFVFNFLSIMYVSVLIYYGLLFLGKKYVIVRAHTTTFSSARNHWNFRYICLENCFKYRSFQLNSVIALLNIVQCVNDCVFVY